MNIQIEGPAVAHIDKTFRNGLEIDRRTAHNDHPQRYSCKNRRECRFRSSASDLAGRTFKGTAPLEEDLPHGETGILEAYERAINNAERYIYIENQYFTSPEIVNALIARLKDPSKPKLQIILVLEFPPGFARLPR